MQSRIRLLGLERLGGVEIYAPGLSEPEGQGATLHILADQLTLSQQGANYARQITTCHPLSDL
jgi:hypothetical protein